jgi:hypothetical protein
VAKAAGISTRTVKLDGKYAQALDRIGDVSPDAKSDILRGSLKLSKRDVVAIGQRDGEGIAEAFHNVRDGRKWHDNGQSPAAAPARNVKDSAGRDVPPHLSDEHGAAAAINSAANKLNAIKRDVAKLAGKAGEQFIPLSEIQQAFTKLKGLIAQSRYWSECPKCRGHVESSCRRCDGTGFIPFKRRGMLSAAEQEWLGV